MNMEEAFLQEAKMALEMRLKVEAADTNMEVVVPLNIFEVIRKLTMKLTMKE